MRLGLIAWLLVGLLISVWADTGDVEPKIQPGYEPEGDITEDGLWLELEEYETALARSALLIKDEKLNEYVKGAACRVTGDYCNDLRIYIIRNPNFNASMAANGVMVVWTGLLVRVSSEDELAAVIGHELAHYTQLHILDRLRLIKNNMAAGSIFDLGLLVFTGVGVPVGQMTAIASLMAFSREQEEEADFMGVNFMAQAGYDPMAAARVWEMIVEEEENAAVKSRKPGLFSKTHPSSADRITNLKAYVDERYSKIEPDPEGRARHVDILEHYYMQLMEDQLDTNRFGRTEVMLRRHREIGVNESLIHFFQGEMYRQRNEEGDLKLAIEEYMMAVKGDRPIADAHLNLGYLYLKHDDLKRAKEHFARYLEIKPDADDRAMVEFYLQETAL